MQVMNGDHAQYEIDNKDVKPEDRSDWPLPSFDARDWAGSFCKRFTVARRDGSTDDGDDIGLMIGWFANALMRGFDEGCSRSATNKD